MNIVDHIPRYLHICLILVECKALLASGSAHAKLEALYIYIYIYIYIQYHIQKNRPVDMTR